MFQSKLNKDTWEKIHKVNTLEQILCNELKYIIVKKPCDRCRGEGWTWIPAYHNDSVKGRCYTCEGKGLVFSHYEKI